MSARARRGAARPGRRRPQQPAAGEPASWTFLTNHGHVLLCLAANPETPLRQVALTVGITERSVQRIVSDLEQGGYLVRTREGRRNRYAIHRALPLRHPLEMHKRVGDLIALVLER